ncbi:hypothetical protein B566_EDAN008649 [Ephemera danica]|nr:hypothetical protein B566_EDAN008649 [Ephemera danica]
MGTVKSGVHVTLTFSIAGRRCAERQQEKPPPLLAPPKQQRCQCFLLLRYRAVLDRRATRTPPEANVQYYNAVNISVKTHPKPYCIPTSSTPASP